MKKMKKLQKRLLLALKRLLSVKNLLLYLGKSIRLLLYRMYILLGRYLRKRLMRIGKRDWEVDRIRKERLLLISCTSSKSVLVSHLFHTLSSILISFHPPLISSLIQHLPAQIVRRCPNTDSQDAYSESTILQHRIRISPGSHCQLQPCPCWRYFQQRSALHHLLSCSLIPVT